MLFTVIAPLLSTLLLPLLPCPQVDVRRSVRDRPGGAGRYVEPQYHEIIRIWVGCPQLCGEQPCHAG